MLTPKIAKFGFRKATVCLYIYIAINAPEFHDSHEAIVRETLQDVFLTKMQNSQLSK